jgi:hypothetical protein
METVLRDREILRDALKFAQNWFPACYYRSVSTAKYDEVMEVIQLALEDTLSGK